MVNEKVVDDIDKLAFATTRSKIQGHQPSVGAKAGERAKEKSVPRIAGRENLVSRMLEVAIPIPIVLSATFYPSSGAMLAKQGSNVYVSQEPL